MARLLTRREATVMMRFARAGMLAGIALLLASPARAQVSCASPDNLCTGDPCITLVTTVQSPCNVDFGNRTVIIGKRIRLPDGGTLHFTARDINVKSILDGHGLHGGSITLTALGRIDQRGRIDASGSLQVGTIMMQAGSDIALTGKVKAVANNGSNLAGGTVTFDAGGKVTCSAACGVDVRGNGSGAGGQALYNGIGGVDLVGHLVAEGGTGPHIEFTSGAGAVVVGTDIRMRSRVGAGGYILLQGATVSNITRSIEARGQTTGGTIQLIAPSVILTQGARAPGAIGGQVLISASTVQTIQPMEANGASGGGLIQVDADSISINSSVHTTGPGGHVSLVASAGDLAMHGVFDVRGGGGVLEASASGNLTVTGQFQGGGGCITLHAGGVLDTSGATSDTPYSASCP